VKTRQFTQISQSVENGEARQGRETQEVDGGGGGGEWLEGGNGL
jgi:hypothetical protein